MKLLVTGGLGFIGSNFVRYMLSEHSGTRIINVDKIGLGANPENLENIENVENYRFVKGDISSPRVIDKLVREIDVVVNFAAETHVDRSISDPASFVESNVLGTFTLLKASGSSTKTVGTSKSRRMRFTGTYLKAPFWKPIGLTLRIHTRRPKPPRTCCAWHTTGHTG